MQTKTTMQFSKFKIFILSLVFIGVTFSAYAQKTKTYYIGCRNQKTIKSDAVYKRKITKHEDKWSVADYYLNDSLHRIGQFLDKDLKTKIDTFRIYHINGNFARINTYENGLLNGEWIEYDISGEEIRTLIFTNGKRERNATWYNRDLDPFCLIPVKETFEHYKLESAPSYPGGNEAFHKYFDSLEYPNISVADGHYGQTVVTFKVSETGKISDIDVILHGSEELDAFAKDLISGMPDWEPATVNDKPVERFVVHPITFILDLNKEAISNRTKANAFFVSGIEDYKNNKFKNAAFKFENAINYDKANAKYYYYYAVSLYQYDPDLACEYFKIADMLDSKIVTPEAKKFCNF